MRPPARPPSLASTSRPSSSGWAGTLAPCPLRRAAPHPQPRRPTPPRRRGLAPPDRCAALPAPTPPGPPLGPLGPLAPGQALIPSTCQAETYDALAARAVALAGRTAGRVVIALAGGPGSGKSTAAAGVAVRVCATLPPGPGAPPGAASAVVLPMDGFHYTRAQLDAFPDPAAAHARRGAPWTFDARAFAAAVTAAALPGASLDAPSFDHGAGDPVAGGVAIRPWHRVVIVEGNYVLCGGEWGPVGDAAAEKWFLGCPTEDAMKRVFHRQVRQGRRPGDVARRIAENDRPNCELVNACVGRADVVARSDLPAGRRGG